MNKGLKIYLGVMSVVVVGLLIWVLAIVNHSKSLTTGSVVPATIATSDYDPATGLSNVNVRNLSVQQLSDFGGAATFGVFTSTGTTTLGYTPNQVNAASTSFTTGTTTMCSIQNTSGASRVVIRAPLDLNSVTSSATATITWGVSSGASIAPTSSIWISQAFATSTDQQVLSTTTNANLIWPNGYYMVLKASATSTQTGNCKVNYIPF